MYPLQGNSIRFDAREKFIQAWEDGAYLPALESLAASTTYTDVSYNAITGMQSETNRAVDEDLIIMAFAICAMIIFTAVVLGE